MVDYRYRMLDGGCIYPICTAENTKEQRACLGFAPYIPVDNMGCKHLGGASKICYREVPKDAGQSNG